MSRYDDNRRDTSRQRQNGRTRNGQPKEPTASRSPRSQGGQVGNLRQVSPQMRERYGVSGYSQGTRRGFDDDWGYPEDYSGRRSARGSNDWREPSVDPIGGRNLRKQSRAGIFSQLSLPFIIGIAVIVVLLVAIIVVATSRCSEGSAETPAAGSSTEQTDTNIQGSESTSESGSASSNASKSTSAAISSSSAADDGIDRAKLESILESDGADKLINRASQSDEAKWIAQNPDKFAMDGIEVQTKLLKLAADEPAAQQYVRNFPDKYPMKTPESGQIKTVTTGLNIPRFYQWDELWGYTVYSGTAFGLTGCCPTCLAMVYQGITGNHDLSPYDMGELAVRDGFATEYEGTVADFLVEEAYNLDLPVNEIDVTEKALKNALQSNQVVIANFGPGIFTQYGHYVVITAMKEDGTVIMNDPYSEERSNNTWDLKTIVEESQGLYAYG